MSPFSGQMKRNGPVTPTRSGSGLSAAGPIFRPRRRDTRYRMEKPREFRIHPSRSERCRWPPSQRRLRPLRRFLPHQRVASSLELRQPVACFAGCSSHRRPDRRVVHAPRLAFSRRRSVHANGDPSPSSWRQASFPLPRHCGAAGHPDYLLTLAVRPWAKRYGIKSSFRRRGQSWFREGLSVRTLVNGLISCVPVLARFMRWWISFYFRRSPCLHDMLANTKVVLA